jgi:hypothetical protein
LVICFYLVFRVEIEFIRLVGFVMRRYESDHPVPSSALYAWQLLGDSVYKNNPNGERSLMLSRPRLDRGQDVSFVNILKTSFY